MSYVVLVFKLIVVLTKHSSDEVKNTAFQLRCRKNASISRSQLSITASEMLQESFICRELGVKRV